jgi:hypothetical protein
VIYHASAYSSSQNKRVAHYCRLRAIGGENALANVF